MDPAPKELVEKLKSSNNILVTVSANPSVDQLAACIGLTLLLNKLKKHATAVFSGNVPSTIEFLKPQETLEKNTDSLRDFIISLDKSKADKLRYKVEENVVKIFITPYKTSINQNDLDFSQGDFNVDVVLCLGISQQQDLDQAITAHGRILHDAVVASINTREGSELGTINWINTGASSLSEMAAELAKELGDDLVDAQIATALLTGIVAETARFSNEKTSPTTMKYSAELMSAGANQQLVANELQTGSAPLADAPAGAPEATRSSDGTLEIGHPDAAKAPAVAEPKAVPEPAKPEPKAPEPAKNSMPEPKIGKAVSNQTTSTSEPDHQPASRMMLQPPSMSGQLTANSVPEDFDASIDPLTMLGTDKPMLSHLQEGSSVTPPPQPELPKLDLDTPTVIPSELAGSQSETVVSPEPPASLVLPDVPPPASEEPEAVKSEPTFEALPSEPPAPSSASSTPAPDQIKIDAQGNLVLPNSPPPEPPQAPTGQVLTDIEQAVHSPHIEDVKSNQTPATPDAEAARNELAALYSSSPPSTPEPKADIGSSGYLKVQDLPGMEASDQERPSGSPPPPMNGDEPAPNAFSPADTPMNMPLPPSLTLPPADPTPPTSTKSDPSAPPPVPPPFNPLP